MPYMLDGRRLRVGRPFVHPDGRQFGGNWNLYTDSEKAALGITYEADPAPFDSKYNFAAGSPRPLDDGTDSDGSKFTGVRPGIVEQQKKTAATLLSKTDWYVIRKSETDTAIPSNVSTYRTAVRTVCGTREAEIAAVSTTEELEALMKAPDKIKNDAGEFVDNPAAHLTPWPELAE